MKKWLIAGLGTAGVLLSSAALARVDVGISIGVPGYVVPAPVYVAPPPPVYVAPPPRVYVAPPPPVYVRPPVVYPAPVYYGPRYYGGRGHHYYRHHHHHRGHWRD